MAVRCIDDECKPQRALPFRDMRFFMRSQKGKDIFNAKTSLLAPKNNLPAQKRRTTIRDYFSPLPPSSNSKPHTDLNSIVPDVSGIELAASGNLVRVSDSGSKSSPSSPLESDEDEWHPPSNDNDHEKESAPSPFRHTSDSKTSSLHQREGLEGSISRDPLCSTDPSDDEDADDVLIGVSLYSPATTPSPWKLPAQSICPSSPMYKMSVSSTASPSAHVSPKTEKRKLVMPEFSAFLSSEDNRENQCLMKKSKADPKLRSPRCPPTPRSRYTSPVLAGSTQQLFRNDNSPLSPLALGGRSPSGVRRSGTSCRVNALCTPPSSSSSSSTAPTSSSHSSFAPTSSTSSSSRKPASMPFLTSSSNSNYCWSPFRSFVSPPLCPVDPTSCESQTEEEKGAAWAPVRIRDELAACPETSGAMEPSGAWPSPVSPQENVDLAVSKALSSRGLRLLGFLGSGDYGNVYKVLEESTRQLWAVKKDHRPLRSLKSVHGAEKHMRLLNKLGVHPNLVFIRESWHQSGTCFTLMELCDGSLSSLLNSGDAFDETWVWNLLSHLSSGLQRIHSCGLMHLDLTPENIFLSEANGDLKIGDFDRLCECSDQEGSDIGTAAYMPKEVMEGQFSPKVDIFSLGMIAFECLTRSQLPSRGTQWHHLRDQPLPWDSADASSPLLTLVERMVAVDPEVRPSASEVMEACYEACQKRLTL